MNAPDILLFASCIRRAETSMQPVVRVAVMSCAMPIALRSPLAIVLVCLSVLR